MSTTRPPAVLFVCLHGSAKSLIALEHFRPRRVTRDDVARATRVVTFGCALEDLAGPELTDFTTARDAIVARLGRLLAE